MRLTIFHQSTEISFEVKSFAHYGQSFFVFEADLTQDLYEFLAPVVWQQPTPDFYQLTKDTHWTLK